MKLPQFTLFSVPKKMRDQDTINQDNAIRSWLELDPRPQILLMGEDAIADELEKYYPFIETCPVAPNVYGTPVISSAFDLAQELAVHEILMYTNADIMFTDELPAAIQAVLFYVDALKPFMVIGRRWDIDIPDNLSMGTNWQKWLRNYVYTHGILHQPAGLDYFIFRKGTIRDMPPFALGRFRWDNWLVWYARKHDFIVIDATEAIFAAHLNHDYAHTREGTKDGAYKGPEARNNEKLARRTGCDRWCTTEDATHYLTPSLELLSRG